MSESGRLQTLTWFCTRRLKTPELRFAMEWIVLLVIIIILGALAGGDSLGETIRSGLGCLVWIVLALLALAFFIGVANQA